MESRDFTPATGHLHARGDGHDVQFYDDESFLYEIVGTFLADGQFAGEPVLCVAREDHRAGFIAKVQARGAEPAGITFFDAREVMSLFMDGAMPDERRFMTVIGSILEEAVTTAPGARIRAYGEMVDVLWRDGNAAAAIRVEELWNALATLYPLTLLCGYGMENFATDGAASPFAAICNEHGRVFPAEGYRREDGDDERLREIARLQQRAAALEAEVSHRRQLETALREALRTKDEFLATLSHELRTPLTAILGWSRLLQGGTLDGATAQLGVETIERSAKAQATLIDDLLDISRVVRGKMTLSTSPVDVRLPVKNAIETIRLAADARDIRIDVREPAEPCIVMGDVTRLQQIAWNLLSNAVKFSAAAETVSIAIEPGESTVHLVVRDAGQGIAQEFLPHVFEPFRQADGATTRQHNGLGLGLAIVKYLVEAHGGSVHAASDGRGAGATFTVALPLASTA
jgi:signal transduction histidine kinase